ncbi:unnamed protein product [Auanema sp. JU1783]|nr:unnamed protein product [Auanema sp. JU1783]
MPASSSTFSAADFKDLKDNFLSNPSEENCVHVIKSLFYVATEDPENDIWLDCKDVIVSVLTPKNLTYILQSQQALILQALSLSSNVTALLAELLERNSSVIGELSTPVAVAILQKMEDSDSFESIAKVISRLCYKKEIADELIFRVNKYTSSEARFRLYQVLLFSIQFDTFNERLLPLFERLKKELSGDVLVQLAALDLLSDIAIASNTGASLLTESKVPQQVYEVLTSSRDSPDGGFLFTATIKFFGCLGKCYPAVLTEFPDFVRLLFHQISNYDVLDASQRVLVVETFAYVAYSTDSKLILQSVYNDQLDVVFNSLGTALKSGPIELRAKIVDAIEILFRHDVDDILSIWFKSITELGTAISKFSLMPFREIRLATLCLLRTLSTLSGPIEYLLRKENEEFVDWLCDATVETEWELQVVKRECIQTILNQDYKFIDDSLRAKLRSYFVRSAAAPEVATMGQ